MSSRFAAADRSALFTDLYELAMLSAYYELRMEHTAVFEFSVRQLPEQRNFLIAAGLEQVLDYVEALRFTEHDLAWLDSTGKFKQSFLDRLAKWHFGGNIDAMQEGTVCFANEPILRVEAPLPEAQLLQTRLINLLHFQTLIASKAARCRLAAGQRTLIDFGMRQAHGAEAALLAARASYIAGFDATSNVEAARRFDIPCSGTMAASFIQARGREAEVFRSFARARPDNLTVLVDTCDTAQAAEQVVALARELDDQGIKISSVQLDSGDLQKEAAHVRAILDRGGCPGIKIFASGSIDEHDIDAFVKRNASIDGFGIGTALTVSTDAPALDCTYELQEYAGIPRRQRSSGKKAWPGRRQIYRRYDDAGKIALDCVTPAQEIAEGTRLLLPVMIHGARLAAPLRPSQLRAHCTAEIATLPSAYLSLDRKAGSPVRVSDTLHELADEVDRRSEEGPGPRRPGTY